MLPNSGAARFRQNGFPTVLATVTTAICRCTFFCGEFLLCERLRPSNIDASAGSVEELKRIVKQIRGVWPKVRIAVAWRLGILSGGADGLV